jgi:hypothetical protein
VSYGNGPQEPTIIVAFVAANVVSLGSAAWKLRSPGTDEPWTLSLVCSTAAAMAGNTWLIELGVRWVASLFVDDVRVFPPATFTMTLGFLGAVFVGPVAMVGAVLLRAKRTPPPIYAIQVSQLVAWVLSVPMLLIAESWHQPT